METNDSNDYLIINDKSKPPKGFKQWALHILEYFLHGMVDFTG